MPQVSIPGAQKYQISKYGIQIDIYLCMWLNSFLIHNYDQQKNYKIPGLYYGYFVIAMHFVALGRHTDIRGI